MPAGLQVYNDSYTLQITEERKNYCLLRSGSITLSDMRSYSNKPFDSCWTGAAPPTVDSMRWQSLFTAFRGRDGAFIGTGSFGEFFGVNNSATVPPVVDYWLFGEPNTTPSGGGFEVYDASGKLSFSSFHKQLVISGIITDGGFNNTSSAGNYAIIGSSIAIIGPGTIRDIGSGSYEWRERRPVWATSGNTGFTGKYIDYIYRQDFGFPTNQGNPASYSLLVNVANL